VFIVNLPLRHAQQMIVQPLSSVSARVMQFKQIVAIIHFRVFLQFAR
jgi:hypothetical protein